MFISGVFVTIDKNQFVYLRKTFCNSNKRNLSMSKKNKAYTKPEVKKVTIDNNINMVMMSTGPGGDPGSLKFLNLLRWWK